MTGVPSIIILRGGAADDSRQNKGTPRGTELDTSRACPPYGHHPASIVELAKTFSVSTDYLLGVEPLASINVSGLDEKDVAALAMLADRLRATKD